MKLGTEFITEIELNYNKIIFQYSKFHDLCPLHL